MKKIIDKTIRIFNYIFAFSISFTQIGGYVTGGLTFLFSWHFWKKLRKDKMFFWLKLFIIYGLLRSVFSYDPMTGYNTMLGYFSHWLLPFILGYAIIDYLSVKKAFWIYYFTFSLILVLSLFAYFGLFFKVVGKDFYLVNEGLLKAFHSHIALGALCLLFSSLSIGQYFYNDEFSGKKRNMFIFAALVFLGSIFLTGSRGYYIAAFVMYLAFGIFFLTMKAARLRWIIGVVSLITFFITTLYLFSPYIRVRIKRTNFQDESIQERISLYKVAVFEFKTSPLFGYGPGQGIKQTEFFNILPENRRNVQRHPHFHSFYLNFMADFGLAGFIILIMILFTWIKRLWENYKLEKHFIKALSFGLFWGLLGVLAGDCLDTMMGGPRVAMELFWMAGLIFGNENRKEVAGED